MARWHPNHHYDQHPAGDHDADCCPDAPGVRIRPVSFAELEDYLEHLANPTQRPPHPRARLVGITAPQPGFLDPHGRPGRSAMAEYRRRRAAHWQSWQPTLPPRIAAVLAAAVSTGLLTAGAAGSRLAWLTGLAAGAALAWRLRFRPTADTLAWRRGAHGEQRTARLLAPLERQGYQIFHDLAIPGSAANLDHLVVGPTGVFVIDSKRYRGHLHYSAGRLWHGRRPLDRTLDTLWWEATQAAETLGFGPDLHIYPVLCVHVARLPWLRELLVDGIPVLAASALRPALQTTRQALSPEQVELVAAHVHASFQAAA
jgi:Nuclease-related domain